MMIDKKNIKFAPKVKEIDRQYEMNNNAELDNGVQHADDEEEEEEKAFKNHSIETSFKGSEDGDQEEQQNNKDSEWQRLERELMETEEGEEEDEEELLLEGGQTKTLVLDEEALAEVEKAGYPRQYIKNCLNVDELNYATTFYHLTCIRHKEY